MNYHLALPDQPFVTPNGRHHWSVRARAAEAWRAATATVARAARVDGMPRPIVGPVDITLTMVAPDRRRRDPDSLSLAAKQAVDGLVDAGVLVDDSSLYVRQVACRILPPDGTKRRSWRLSVTPVTDVGDDT